MSTTQIMSGAEGLTYMPFGASKFVELFLSLEGDLARHVISEVKTNPSSKLEGRS